MYCEPSQTCMINVFANTANSLQLLPIFTKSYIMSDWVPNIFHKIIVEKKSYIEDKKE